MTATVTVRNRTPSEIMDIAAKLQVDGWVLGKDFDYAYYPGRWDEMIGNVPARTIFTFYREKYATLFALRYGS